MIRLRYKIALLIFLSSIFTGFIFSASKKPVGMVLDTYGNANKAIYNKKTRKLSPMDNLKAGDILITGKGSNITFVLFSTNVEYTVKESSKVIVLPYKIKAIKGSVKGASSKVALNLPENSVVYSRKQLGEVVAGQQPVILRPKPSKATRGTFKAAAPHRMPDMPCEAAPVEIENEPPEILYPVTDNSIIDGNVTFKWRFNKVPKQAILFIVEPDTDTRKGKVLYYTDVKGRNSLRYPCQKASPLKYNNKYGIIILGYFPPIQKDRKKGEAFYSSSWFKVLPKKKALEIRKLRKIAQNVIDNKPGENAPLIKLMLIYLDNSLYTEAVKLGEILEERLPNNPNIYFYMGEAYKKLKNKYKAEEYDKKYKRLIK